MNRKLFFLSVSIFLFALLLPALALAEQPKSLFDIHHPQPLQ